MQNPKQKNYDPENVGGAAPRRSGCSVVRIVLRLRKGLFLTLLVNTTLIYETP